MSAVDIFLLSLLAIFAFYGLALGFVRAFGGLIGAVASFFIATKLYLPLAASPFGVLLGGNTNVGRVVSFALIFILIARVIGFVIYTADKVFKFISVIPFLQTINRLAGAVFGFLEGVVLLAGLVYIAGKYPFMEELAVKLVESRVAQQLNLIMRLFQFLYPNWLTDLRSIFDAPTGQAATYIRTYFKF